MRERVYRAAIAAARALLPLTAWLGRKLGRGVRGRRGAADRLIAWADAHRDRARPLVWVHAPSVGEALMAKAIIAALRARRADAQLAFTYFSPSAERVKDTVGADVADYLPWDHPSEIAPALDALQPAAVAFVRTEIWPELVRESHDRGVPTLLLNGVLREASGRLGRPGRWLLAEAYARLAAVGAASDEDAALFPRLGVAAERIRVTGDARFDQVWERVREKAGLHARVAARFRGPRDEFTIVAGSTWPADEERLVAALAQARAVQPIHLVIAPHEPTEQHVRSLERALAAAGIGAVRLSRLEEGSVGPAADDVRVRRPPALPDALILDRMGVLADAYAAGDAAYVGGGFGGSGLHSVVEPAAFGLPVIFGPRHGNAREAGALRDHGGAIEVRDPAELCAALIGLARAPEAARKVGDAARDFVRGRLGAADRSAALIAEVLGWREP